MKRRKVMLWTVRSGQLDLLRAAIEGERSHDETDRKAQATKDGLSCRTALGQPVGPIPLGYTWRYLLDEHGQAVHDKRGKPITVRVIDPLIAPLVERIFALIERGATRGDVARNLNAEGIRTRPRGKAKNGAFGPTQRWATSS